MRGFVLLLALSGMAGAQSLAEYGAAAAGGATGGAAGKKVSEGITSIFGKVNKQAADAAKQGTTKPADAKPAQPAAPATTARVTQPAEFQSSTPSSASRRAAKTADPSQVPDPPGQTPVRHVAPKKTAAPSFNAAPVPFLDLISLPPLPPPPVATAEALRTLARGATRADVLSLGFPSSRISMNDDGHLGEIYGYTRDDVTFGVVRLTDGVVSSVEVR